MSDRASGELVEARGRLDSLPASPGGPPVPPRVKLTPLQPGQPGLAAYYDATMLNTLRTLWRAKLMILAFLAAGVAVALTAIILSPKRYTAEAVLQLDFAAREGGAPANAGPSVDAAILVEGEARILRSSTLARRVVARLKLEDNPAYTTVGPLSQLLRLLSPAPEGAPGVSKADIAAAKLVKQLQVTNDPRSYLINVTIVSNSPEWSAELANAFAIEYLQHRILQELRQAQTRARTALEEARAFYGEKHPQLIQARTQLEAVEARIRDQEALPANQVSPPPGHAFLKAEPVWLPSGPNPVAFLGTGIFGSLFAAIALALLLDRRNTSLRTERSVVAETGIRCVGMIPKRADRARADRKREQQEAFHSLCLTLDLTAQKSDGARVMMVTSALPIKAKAPFIKDFAACLTEAGKRVLIIDMVEPASFGKSISLDDVVNNPVLMRDFLKEQEHAPVSELRRKSGPTAARRPLTSLTQAEWAFEQLLEEAKPHYDVLVIDTPPTLLFSDSVFLGRFADLSLQVVVWNETPRETVLEAVRRLQEHMIRVDGIVLIEIDLARYASFEAGDRTYYLSKHTKLFASS
jgi:Mrp family chromosome partitioning ATPase